MKNDNNSLKRRHFLTNLTKVVGGIGAVFALIPFLSTMSPSEKTKMAILVFSLGDMVDRKGISAKTAPIPPTTLVKFVRKCLLFSELLSFFIPANHNLNSVRNISYNHSLIYTFRHSY